MGVAISGGELEFLLSLVLLSLVEDGGGRVEKANTQSIPNELNIEFI